MNIKAIWFPLTLLNISAFMVGVTYECTPLALMFSLVCIVLTLDCIGRHKEFVKNKGKDFCHREARRASRSRCGRVAYLEALKANPDPSQAVLAYNMYESMGIRWWHVFPIGTFSRNSPFIKKKFWIELLLGR